MGNEHTKHRRRKGKEKGNEGIGSNCRYESGEEFSDAAEGGENNLGAAGEPEEMHGQQLHNSSTQSSCSSNGTKRDPEFSQDRSASISSRRRISRTERHLSMCAEISDAVRLALDRQKEKTTQAENGFEQSQEEIYQAKEMFVPHSARASSSRSSIAVDYAPKVFESLRSLFGVSEGSYRISICEAALKGSGAGAGASGSLFFTSADNRYIIKSLPKAETVKLRGILKAYHQHMMKNNNSLLPKFYGLYKLRAGRRWMRVVVMNNVFFTPLKIHEKYDLKGSKVNRHVSEAKQQAHTDRGEVAVLKDSDLNTSVWLTNAEREMMIAQAHRDGQFLCSHGIMDYSLLLGIHKVSEEISDVHGARLNLENEGGVEGGGDSFDAYRDDAETYALLQDLKRMVSEASDESDLTYVVVKRKLIELHGGPTFESCKTEIKRILEKQVYAKRTLSRWHCHMGGMKAYAGRVRNKLSRVVVFVAIIDVLQQWNMGKKMEKFVKVCHRASCCSSVCFSFP